MHFWWYMLCIRIRIQKKSICCLLPWPQSHAETGCLILFNSRFQIVSVITNGHGYALFTRGILRRLYFKPCTDDWDSSTDGESAINEIFPDHPPIPVIPRGPLRILMFPRIPVTGL